MQLIALFFLMASTTLSASPAIDFDRLSSCIAQVESSNNDMAIGKQGERGRYQIQQQLWQQISHLPFDQAHNPTEAKKVAIRHLEWLSNKFRDHQSLDRSRVYLIALGWNAGPQAVLHLFATRNQREYAQRVESLYLSEHATETLSRQ